MIMMMMTMTARISGCPVECMNGPSIMLVVWGPDYIATPVVLASKYDTFTKISIVWDETPCSLVDVYHYF
jgi:hypothetical protein